MAIANDLHTLFGARREAFEIVDRQPPDDDLYCIVEELSKLLYTIQFDKEYGGNNPIGLIMDKADYTKRFGAPFPRPNRLAIYDESIADGATGVIRSKEEAMHCARITNWDTFEAAEREAREFIIDAFDEAWYSELCKPVTFYVRVTMRQMLEHPQGICVVNHTIVILELQEKIRVMHTEHDSIAQYILVLEEVQQQAARTGVPITDATLVIIAMKAMLATQQSTTTNEKWGSYVDLRRRG